MIPEGFTDFQNDFHSQKYGSYSNWCSYITCDEFLINSHGYPTVWHKKFYVEFNFTIGDDNIEDYILYMALTTDQGIQWPQ